MTERQALELPGGVRAVVHVGGAETAGAFTLIADVAPPGWSLPTHRHDVSETIYVTAGRMWVEIDGRRQELTAGDSVYVPEGAPHRGGTVGKVALERMLVFAPAGMEHFFAELAVLSEPRAMLDLAHMHGWRFD